ncbi:MAG: ATP-binding protein, partial [Elsteraceae bacterium]
MTSADSIDAPASAAPSSAGVGETMAFQAEVSRLLDIVAHALYSEREIFLRELISNASDASDKLRYLSATDASIGVGASTARITLQADQAAKTLTIADDGVGMTREELVDNLGTIARSGTGRFMAQFKGEAKPDLSMIGQFGVGFYSAFMVADHVQVISRHVGSDAAWSWSSDGRGSFKIAPAERATYGTTIILHIKEDAAEFLEAERVKTV